MSLCPFCHRRLLSQASPACNWCGKEIPDAAYQQNAAVKREVLHVQQALHDAESLAAIEGLNRNMGGLWVSPLDLLRRLPPVVQVVPYIQPRPTPPAGEEPVPEETTAGRFRHLEL